MSLYKVQSSNDPLLKLLIILLRQHPPLQIGKNSQYTHLESWKQEVDMYIFINSKWFFKPSNVPTIFDGMFTSSQHLYNSPLGPIINELVCVAEQFFLHRENDGQINSFDWMKKFFLSDKDNEGYINCVCELL